uniref:OSIGBa0145N07.11 protein n=1 Tax=Oryza sativa TaxID=4530 RepID=Q01LB6_ORYSA|nr:OSIGBa0145N07.11 [Oryza sativa]
MPRKIVEILSDDSDSSSEDSEYCIESDDNDVENVVFEGLNGAKLDKLLCKMNKKIIQDLKRKFSSSSSHLHKKTKGKKQKQIVKNDYSFTRFSVKYFCEVLSSLSEHQKKKIASYGFGSLLLFDSHAVPNKFASWIASKVDVTTSEIILRDKIIPVTKHSVHAVLDLPIGGLEFGRDRERGKQFILSKFGQLSIPSVKYFGDQFIQKKVMSDEDVIISFLIVALACFLCPNSSLTPSTKYLTIFEDVDSLRSYDWSKFVYDWLMYSVKKFKKRKSLGGCFYLWAVQYLDCVDFGERYIDQSIPRIAVWKKGMITTFSDLDKIDENTFGLRHVKDFSTTCYYKYTHSHSDSISFRDKLESAIGNALPDVLKDKICDMVVPYCSKNHISDSQPFQDIVISVFLMIAQSNTMDYVQADNELVDGFGVDNQVENDSHARIAGVHTGTPTNTIDNQADFDNNTTSKSNGKDCSSLERIAHLYGSVANADHQNISLNNVTVQHIATNQNGGNFAVSNFAQQSTRVLSSHNHAKLTSGDCQNLRSRGIGLDTNLLSPDVGYPSNHNTAVNESLKSSFVSAAAVNAVKIVANKFKSRLSQFNNHDNTGHIFDEPRPRFKLFDSDDELYNSGKENEEFRADTTSQDFASFQSIDDSPVQITPMNWSHNMQVDKSTFQKNQNVNKRTLQDLTNSPDVIFLRESKFPEQCKKLCVKTEVLYNSNNNMSIGSRDSSSSGGKLPAHGPRRIIIPGRYASDPYVPQRPRFAVSDEDNRYFVAICCLANSSKWKSYEAVDIDNVKIKFYSFGHSMKRGGFISPYVISAFCRIMFHNNHPSKSKKNYFFPSIGEQLISQPISNDNLSHFEKVKNSFDGAAKARKLHLCDMLFFPIQFNQHWFLFIVDIKDRLLVFLDSLHTEGDEYFEPIFSLLLNNFQTAWDKFVGANIDFSTFTIKFPPVPHQEYR